jgi:hypothetical protein
MQTSALRYKARLGLVDPWQDRIEKFFQGGLLHVPLYAMIIAVSLAVSASLVLFATDSRLQTF